MIPDNKEDGYIYYIFFAPRESETKVLRYRNKHLQEPLQRPNHIQQMENPTSAMRKQHTKMINQLIRKMAGSSKDGIDTDLQLITKNTLLQQWFIVSYIIKSQRNSNRSCCLSVGGCFQQGHASCLFPHVLMYIVHRKFLGLQEIFFRSHWS